MPLDNTTREQQDSKAYRGEWLGQVGGFWLAIGSHHPSHGSSIWLITVMCRAWLRPTERS
jgi:hypothetical protein